MALGPACKLSWKVPCSTIILIATCRERPARRAYRHISASERYPPGKSWPPLPTWLSRALAATPFWLKSVGENSTDTSFSTIQTFTAIRCARNSGTSPGVRTPGILVPWCKGLTGFPIVDAGMRELWHTGWMHNRVRMIVGSFLVKDLLAPLASRRDLVLGYPGGRRLGQQPWQLAVGRRLRS